ncbi:MAG: SCO family protein [Gammaproteobacteria bacterium]|nr:SCO family protein [Gammaproteobacteria bacterium]
MSTEIDTIQEQPAPRRKKTPWSKRIYLLLFGLVLATGVKTLVENSLTAPMPATPYNNVGGTFTLQSAQGPITEKALLGKVTVLTFGYTECPDICPTTLNKIGSALRILHETGDLPGAQAFFVSLDHERDSVDKLNDYTDYFHQNILGLTGTEDQIQKMAYLYKIGYGKDQVQADGSYTMSHSGYLYIIRPDGQVAELMSHGTTPKELVKAIQRWLPWAQDSST